MADEFTPVLAAGVLHAAPLKVVIVRNARGWVSTRTNCDSIVSYPGPDWRGAKKICVRCLPGEDLESLAALNA